MSGTRLIAPDPVLGFVPAPNADTERVHPRAGLDYHVYNTERGARVARPGLLTPRQVDVVVVGCSFSWGAGVEGSEAWPLVMGERLGATVANLAFASYSGTQSALMLSRNLDLRPRLVIYGLIDDHERRNVLPCAPNYAPTCLPAPSVAFDAADRPFIRPPVMDEYPLTERFWQAFLVERRLGPRQVLVAAQTEFAQARRRAFQSPDVRHRAIGVAFLVDSMRREATAAGARFVVVRLPDFRPGVDTRMAPPVAAGLSAVAGLELIDLGLAVQKYYEADNQPLTFERDPHPNALAHRLVGELLAQQALERNWLSPAP